MKAETEKEINMRMNAANDQKITPCQTVGSGPSRKQARNSDLANPIFGSLNDVKKMTELAKRLNPEWV